MTDNHKQIFAFLILVGLIHIEVTGINKSEEISLYGRLLEDHRLLRFSLFDKIKTKSLNYRHVYIIFNYKYT